ncbi:PEP-CTERM sorting domain-containing protein [Chitiniphilus purpureus]|uniref:PEP-CTERM sorting domain-containing protein n=1 Tax=Chitiniphilus purpureus TaxID=2981137 RepID=A0ABY6DT98_9NEIS|nr:PEP-CTERM sorting domain-containing protein [Chitiniphilus sp. CD1]UXY16296.1 PEP-CTERM sorting domain-containing protein [Chitiniphilus sp. CD1]
MLGKKWVLALATAVCAAPSMGALVQLEGKDVIYRYESTQVPGFWEVSVDANTLRIARKGGGALFDQALSGGGQQEFLAEMPSLLFKIEARNGKTIDRLGSHVDATATGHVSGSDRFINAAVTSSVESNWFNYGQVPEHAFQTTFSQGWQSPQDDAAAPQGAQLPQVWQRSDRHEWQSCKGMDGCMPCPQAGAACKPFAVAAQPVDIRLRLGLSGGYTAYDSPDAALQLTLNGYGITAYTQVSPVPEPATYALTGAGLVGLMLARLRRRGQKPR